MKWIDMHCDTLSEIIKTKEKDKNTKESLHRNHLCVDGFRGTILCMLCKCGGIWHFSYADNTSERVPCQA